MSTAFITGGMTNHEKLLTVKGGLEGMLIAQRDDQERLQSLFIKKAIPAPFQLRITFLQKMIAILTEVIESDLDD